MQQLVSACHAHMACSCCICNWCIALKFCGLLQDHTRVRLLPAWLPTPISLWCKSSPASSSLYGRSEEGEKQQQEQNRQEQQRRQAKGSQASSQRPGRPMHAPLRNCFRRDRSHCMQMLHVNMKHLCLLPCSKSSDHVYFDVTLCSRIAMCLCRMNQQTKCLHKRELLKCDHIGRHCPMSSE